MKITETIERECCHPTSDLKPYLGVGIKPQEAKDFKFCVHCGQLWEFTRKPGEMDRGWERISMAGRND